MELADIRQAIIEDVANRDFTNKGIAPFSKPLRPQKFSLLDRHLA